MPAIQKLLVGKDITVPLHKEVICTALLAF